MCVLSLPHSLLTDQCGIVPAACLLRMRHLLQPLQGEYKEGLGEVASCNRCADGVTTEADGSTGVSACKKVLPSFVDIAIDATSGAVSATEK